MLILTRRTGQRVYIGDNVCITLVEIDRNKVRIGIEAPLSVNIMREELLAADDPRKSDEPWELDENDCKW